MQPAFDLPEPDALSRAHSERVHAELLVRVAQQDSWIRFEDFMDFVLYAPGLGYYSAGSSKFGAAGDFVTAPEISPLFGRCMGRACAEVLESLGGGALIEVGAGTGRLLVDVLQELQRLDSLPDSVYVIEVSGDLRERQQVLVHAELGPQLAGSITWLDRLPEKPLSGFLLANEVLDALPVCRFRREPQGVRELGYTVSDGRLVACDRPAGPRLAKAVAGIESDLAQGLPQGFESEICLRLPAWVSAMEAWFETGVALFADYGMSRREYYAPDRRGGTLMCHFRHHAHDDPLRWTGIQDLTAWVDFSLLAASAVDAGFAVSGYTSQAGFLVAAGILSDLENEPPGTGAVNAARTLLMPGEMGERVRVMGLSRGNVARPGGFDARDLRYSL
jgi:SAM-dependent MidA family methyltransferase